MSKALDVLVAFVKRRPTETATGLGLAGAVYGFLAQAGVSHPLAAIVGVVVAFAPATISAVVDAVRKP